MKIYMLGTGTAGAIKLYHTCIAIKNNNEYFIVDGGGGNGVLYQCEKANIDVKKINNIFLSHIHLDHCIGVLWLIRKRFMNFGGSPIQDNQNPLYIYGNEDVLVEFKHLMEIVLKKEVKRVGKEIIFIYVKNGDKYTIDGVEYEFINTYPKKNVMYGFIGRCNGKSLAFVGDETLKPALFEKVKNCDLLIHDAFCLEDEFSDEFLTRTVHTTAKQAGEIATNIGAKALLLFHTMDNHKNKKELFSKEASKTFSGKIYVPDDLDEIIL